MTAWSLEVGVLAAVPRRAQKSIGYAHDLSLVVSINRPIG